MASINSPSPQQSFVAAATPQRNVFIDHIRVLLTALVILHHCAIAYGGAGGWYWRELPEGSNATLVMFNAFNQSFFMGFFFLLAGYFTAPALARKGPLRFLQDRMLRLGIPLLLYFFLLNPLTIAIARMTRGFAFWPGWWQMIVEADFAPGPLWFAEALLIFSVVCVLWRWLSPPHEHGAVALPSFGRLLAIAVLLGGISFFVRLLIPVGEEVLWLQLGYFPCYIALFAAGYVAATDALLEQVTLKQALPWMLMTLAGIVVLAYLVLFRMDKGSFDGGWTLNAVLYALWDPLVGIGVILGMLWATRTWWNRSSPAMAWLARNAYGAFIIHPPVLVGTSVLLAGWAQSGMVKFMAIGTIAVAGSFLGGYLLRHIPGLHRAV